MRYLRHKSKTWFISQEASNLGILVRLASLGLGVAILPESVAAATIGLHAIEIVDPPMRGKVALAGVATAQSVRPRRR